MCKKPIAFLLLFLTLTIIPGCSPGMNFSDNDMNIYKKIHKKYAFMESYAAKAEMIVYSNKTENKYEILQYSKEPKMYRTEFLSPDGEIDFVVIENDGCNIFSPVSSADAISLPSSDSLDCTFINNFFALFYNSQQTTINVSSESPSFITLETEIYPVSKERRKAVMVLDEKANIKSIKIYDAGKNLRTEIVFSEFYYNKHIDDKLFNF